MTADSASTAASARWRGATRARHRAACAPSGPAPPGAGPATGGVAVCWEEVMRQVAPGRAPERLCAGRGSAEGGGSSSERPDQPVEVLLVVPGTDGRSQPGSPGNVTHDDSLLGQAGSLDRWVRALEGHERRVAAGSRLAPPLGEQPAQMRRQRAGAPVNLGP